MLLWAVIIAVLLYILGDLIRGGHIEPEPRWEIIGKFMMGIATAIFIVLLILSIVDAVAIDIKHF